MSKSYNQQGVIKQRDSKNEFKHGMEESFYENGSKMFKCFWKDGVHHGLMTRHWENGQIATEGCWKDGVLHGKETEWYESGIKQCETIYKDGNVMTKRSWKPNGEECDMTKLVNGTGIFVRYTEDGDKVIKRYKNGLDKDSHDYKMIEEEEESSNIGLEGNIAALTWTVVNGAILLVFGYAVYYAYTNYFSE